jgi:hypothetical protein
LHRQKAFLVPGIVPPALQGALSSIPSWEPWDPDHDRWYYGADDFGGAEGFDQNGDGEAELGGQEGFGAPSRGLS